MEVEELHAKVHGKVQMVMYRDFVQKKARSLGLRGCVQNFPDFSVEVVAQGPREHLEKLVGHLHKGPFMARVSRVDTEWREPGGEFKDFSVVY